MLRGLPFHILTLVVFASGVHFQTTASPLPATPRAPLPDASGYENRVKDDGISLRARRPMAAHANQIGVEVRAGKPLPGVDKISNTTGVYYQRAVYSPHLTAWNFGATLTTEIHYGIHADYQWNKFPTRYWEPFWRVGAGALYAGDEETATFIKLERYHARLSAGFEDFAGLDRRLRLESVIFVSLTGALGYGVGLSWAFEDSELWWSN